ncbi:hypothetical protein M3936_17890 [Sutcliffiella horikoshii]|uniref:hypothetical protein n=1 Tax=Sutcliffiella horikoshii TaxID=79883 RepID=UPI00203B95EC|nr:hypothetical protein [Sutcliffiella horikoshii]MCM3619465.1 hypothetical protein [Sutcliffiella horikoshii]
MKNDKIVNYLPYALISLILIVGGFTWSAVITTFKEKGSEPVVFVKPQVEDETAIPEENLKEDMQLIMKVNEGITQEMVKDWNIGKDGIGIDHLLSLIEEHDE